MDTNRASDGIMKPWLLTWPIAVGQTTDINMALGGIIDSENSHGFQL